MSENNKSGYQLRQELLGMARGIVDDKVKRLEVNEFFKSEDIENYKRKTIEPYTTEQVIAEAEKLYTFIKKK
tara:strand:+ start:1462 stop:1677 length:216 start_codon:yes stop_codon:yes gene_type:complete